MKVTMGPALDRSLDDVRRGWREPGWYLIHDTTGDLILGTVGWCDNPGELSSLICDLMFSGTIDTRAPHWVEFGGTSRQPTWTNLSPITYLYALWYAVRCELTALYRSAQDASPLHPLLHMATRAAMVAIVLLFMMLGA